MAYFSSHRARKKAASESIGGRGPGVEVQGHRTLKRPATESLKEVSELVGSRPGSWALRCFYFRHVTRFEFIAKEARDHG
jgi:hypothetical protein